MGFKDNPIVFLAKKTWEHSKGNRKNVVLYLVLSSFSSIISFVEPLIIGMILNIIQEQGLNSSNVGTIILYLTSFIVLTLLSWAFHGPSRVIERKNAFLVKANYKMFLLRGTMNLPAQWHVDHHSGDTIDKIQKGTNALFDFSSNSFVVVDNIFRLISSYIALVYFNLHSAYIVFFIVVFTIYIILRFDKVLVKNYKTLNRKENAISAKIYDSISNITTIIILRIEKIISNSVYKKISEPFKLFSKNAKLNEIKWFLVSVSASVMTFLVLSSYFLFKYNSGQVVLIGTVFILYDYLRRINSMFFNFAFRYSMIVRQRTRVANAEELSIEFKEKIKSRQIALNKGWKEINIKSLNFSYHGKDDADLHLTNVSMKIKHGEKIALVGHSGSGKTTFMKLMRDLYYPKNMKLYVDGIFICQGFKAISSSISLIPQEPEIFTSTIKENITIGVPYTMKNIKKFTDIARFTKTANSLPNKFNSHIVEKGVNLSGGEKQRLALSRGLLASAGKQIILFDEPTSSVDSKNEIKIYKNIFKEFKEQTIISSIHRLHLLKMFDKIYFFKRGEIVASGTFKELLKNSKEFNKLCKEYKIKK